MTKALHAPHRRLSCALVAAFPRIRTQGLLGSSNSRWIMSGGYIDESCHVKNLAVCKCDFSSSKNACSVCTAAEVGRSTQKPRFYVQFSLSGAPDAAWLASRATV